jgi:HdeA/HdeB family
MGLSTKFVPALLVLWLTACAPESPQPMEASASPPLAAAPPAAPGAATPPPGPSEAQIAPRRWDVERVRCSDLLGASDDDRAAAAMFYYGYLAAKAGIRVIDVGKIDANLGKVMSQCEATPNLTVPQAFRQALRPRRSTS